MRRYPLDAIGNSASNSGVCCQKGFRERSEGGAESGSCPQSSQRIVPASVHGHLNRIEAEMLTGIKIANDADVEKVAEEICAMG